MKSTQMQQLHLCQFHFDFFLFLFQFCCIFVLVLLQYFVPSTVRPATLVERIFLSGCDTVSDFLRRVSDVIRTCLNYVRMYQDAQI